MNSLALDSISIVIPAFNEEKRLSKTVSSITEYFSSKEISYEIIIVDDGSQDQTATLVKELKSENPNISPIFLEKNFGKGFAVKTGVSAATKDLILFCDADGSAPISEVEKLVSAITKGAEIAIGSRALYSRNVQIRALLHRKILGRVFAFVVNALILPGVADTQCGFKLFRSDSAKRLFQIQKITHYAFDIEILFLAKKFKFSVKEVAINWSNVPGSKVNLLRDSIRMFFDLLRCKFYDLWGLYSLPTKS